LLAGRQDSVGIESVLGGLVKAREGVIVEGIDDETPYQRGIASATSAIRPKCSSRGSIPVFLAQPLKLCEVNGLSIRTKNTDALRSYNQFNVFMSIGVEPYFQCELARTCSQQRRRNHGWLLNLKEPLLEMVPRVRLLPPASPIIWSEFARRFRGRLRLCLDEPDPKIPAQNSGGLDALRPKYESKLCRQIVEPGEMRNRESHENHAMPQV